MKTLLKIVLGLAITGVIVIAGVVVAFRLSPWPEALLLRHGGALLGDRTPEVVAALSKHVPSGVASRLNVTYGEDYPDSSLDVFFPEHVSGALPTIVWIHGGAFVAGSKDQLRPYLQILASHGYTAVGVEYAKAPERKYPTPVLQLAQALTYVQAHAASLHVDPQRIVLAGDSAGAHMAVQEVLAITNPAYAHEAGIPAALLPGQLRGVVLFSGAYDMSLVPKTGKYAGFLKNLFWAYLGSANPDTSPQYRYLSVVNFVTRAFPPAFVSTGNGDPLLPHSEHLIQALRNNGVPVDAMLFPNAVPPLPHEYEMNLDIPAGREALGQLLQDLATWTGAAEETSTPTR
nr:alpha/beta hydrolase [Dyella flava]